MVGVGGPLEENADEEKALHWTKGPSPGHPLHHTMPPLHPGSPWAKDHGGEKGRPEEEAMLLGGEGLKG